MGDTNYIGSVVKILEKPVQRVISDKIVRTDFRVQLAQVRNIQIAHLVFWGNLARDIINNYQVNDYIMIEGYLSLPNKTNQKLGKDKLKKAQITVLKVYSI
uniref:hypothetical protein n=1 Tax=Navicula tsukamotoi TaxID=2018706 RepID=UPI002182141C|nr:hypothetical protein NDC64_pgp107 [Navicula tsukamotoi]UVG41701.1 hypothetical protein [Navicula tsukamotoi]